MKIVREGQWKPAALGGNNGGSIHEDILALGGRESEVAWEDIFHGMFFSVLPTAGVVIALLKRLVSSR